MSDMFFERKVNYSIFFISSNTHNSLGIGTGRVVEEEVNDLSMAVLGGSMQGGSTLLQQQKQSDFNAKNELSMHLK